MTPNQGVHLRVELLGRLDVRTQTDREIRLTGRHAQALFGLLVLVRRPRSRETIAADLWPEADANTAGSTLTDVRIGSGLHKRDGPVVNIPIF